MAPSSLAWTSGAAVPYACGRNAGLTGQKPECDPSDLSACTYFEEVCECAETCHLLMTFAADHPGSYPEYIIHIPATYT